MLLGLKFMYLMEAQNYLYSQAYNQAEAAKLEPLTCDLLHIRANNNANPSAKVAQGDTKACLIFKIICGCKMMDSQLIGSLIEHTCSVELDAKMGIGELQHSEASM
mmetsp:Transcript_138889/g.241500  ORF Transcript_138889/g.241500 Transcript_138889/m.241500 type:complete len:106 (-) Transcript_138889:255-572(-)